MKYKLAIFLLTVLSCKSRQYSDSETKLISPNIAAANQFPAAVHFTSIKGEKGCSGTKIAARLFLTAGHCLGPLGNPSADRVVKPEYAPSNQFKLIHGVNTIDSPGREFTVTSRRVAIHPTWTALTEPNDVTFLKISDVAVIEIEEDTDIPIAQLDYLPLTVGQSVILTGYGCEQDTMTPRNSDNDIHRLKFAENKVQTVTESTYLIPPKDEAGKDARGCAGDSGSGIYKADGQASHSTLIGLHVFGMTQDKTMRSGQTRIDSHSKNRIDSWIQSQVSQMSSSGTKHATFALSVNRKSCMDKGKMIGPNMFARPEIVCASDLVDACEPYPTLGDYHMCVARKNRSYAEIKSSGIATEVAQGNNAIAIILRPDVAPEDPMKMHRFCFAASDANAAKVLLPDLFGLLKTSEFKRGLNKVLFANKNFEVDDIEKVALRGSKLILSFVIRMKGPAAGGSEPDNMLSATQCL